MDPELKRLLPVTEDEAAMLNEMGWSNGFGWDSNIEPDWWWGERVGPETRVGMDDTARRVFIRDIESIRREIAERDRKQRLAENAEELAEALAWYGEQARLCRLIHSEGDTGRKALNNDGGERARAVLAKVEG